MKYLTLKKAFYHPEVDANALYNERYTSPEAIHLSLNISGTPAFCVMDNFIYQLMLQIAKADKKILSLTQELPGRAIEQFTERTLIDEIVFTNQIEGVNSSRKEIGDVLRSLEKHNKRQRYYGLINKYALLTRRSDIPLETAKNIREIYDDLVLDEIRAADSKNIPDGMLFRKGSESVYNASGIEIHQGVQPESQIVEYLTTSLSFLQDNTIDLLVRAAIFHYLIGYIHPFYDGNGRLNRFISSYLLSREYEPLVGFRLSYAITKSLEKYYKGFDTCNDVLNKGDLTPFVLMFLGIVKEAVEGIVDVLSEKSDLLKQNLNRLARVRLISDDENLSELASVLLQARMFSGDGISTKGLMNVFRVSRPTIMNRLARIAETGLLEREKLGREVHYQLKLEILSQLGGE
jgi:Fic family protein